jgi:hypothetical protein
MRAHRRRAGFWLAAVAATVISTSLAAAPVQADELTTTQTAQNMVFANPVRIVNSMPDSSGDIEVQFSNGRVIPVPSKLSEAVRHRIDALARTVQPFNTVLGDCGTSYITLSDRSSGYPVHMDTGFTLSGGRRAYSYEWSAWIEGFSGSGYSYEYGASGDLSERTSWDGHHTSGKDYPSGAYGAGVNAGWSYALVDYPTLGVCFAGSATDSRNL